MAGRAEEDDGGTVEFFLIFFLIFDFQEQYGVRCNLDFM